MSTLVVGVDGSPDALAAVGWAAAFAGPSGSVRAVHVMEPSSTMVLGALQVDSAAVERDLRHALTHAWTEPARRQGVEPTCVSAIGEPSRVLLAEAAAAGADLVVLGARGLAPVPLALGRVGGSVLRHSEGPVAVVREDAGSPPTAGGPIVVGVGDGAATAAALRWAVSAADARGVGLHLVHAVARPGRGVDGLVEVLAHAIDASAPRRWAEEDLAELADTVRAGAATALTIDWRATSGAAAPALVREAEAVGASLVVVGRHHGPAAALRLPVSLMYVIGHAPCPVVVVPATHGN